MSKNKEAKRKAKKKALKTMSAKIEQARAAHVAEAIMDICRPWEVMFRREKDLLNAFYILWSLGVEAWNCAVNGWLEPEFDEDDSLSEEEKDFNYVVACTLILQKFRMYPNLSVEVSDFSVKMVSGKPRLKVELGISIPLDEIPIPPEKLNFRATPQQIFEEELRKGGSAATLASFVNEPEETILAWLEGKVQLEKDKEELLHLSVETPRVLFEGYEEEHPL